jgi:hypothetical protein
MQILNPEALPIDRASWLLGTSKPLMLAVFKALDEILGSSFPIKLEQEVDEPPAEDTTVMKDGSGSKSPGEALSVPFWIWSLKRSVLIRDSQDRESWHGNPPATEAGLLHVGHY